MVTRHRLLPCAQPGSTILAVALLLAACAPGPRAPTGSGQGGAEPAAPAPKQLTIALEGEPDNLLIGMGPTSGVNVAQVIRLALHQHLANHDERGGVHPMLAAALPSTADGTWIVRADGSMQTRYRLRTGITWHDGTPLTSRDVAFAWAVSSDPTLPISSRAEAEQIRSIETPDDLTLVIEWLATYPFANALAQEDLGPLPAHLAEGVYRADKERFQQLPLWTREAVGVGPYRW